MSSLLGNAIASAAQQPLQQQEVFDPRVVPSAEIGLQGAGTGQGGTGGDLVGGDPTTDAGTELDCGDEGGGHM